MIVVFNRVLRVLRVLRGKKRCYYWRELNAFMEIPLVLHYNEVPR